MSDTVPNFGKPIVAAINGILTDQVDTSWPDELDDWFDAQDIKAKVLKKEYGAGPFPLWNVHWVNRGLSKSIANEIRLLCKDRVRDVHFISHSNGTDIALKAVKRLAAFGIKTKTLIVVGSVLKADVRKNGVADLVQAGHLSKAVAYVSENDSALQFGRFSFGYSDLGRTGWTMGDVPLPPEHSVFATRRFDSYRHSTYFDPKHLDATCRLFCADMGLSAQE